VTDPTDKPRTEPVPVSDLSYSEASRELDDIVSFFEQREVDVDQLVSRLERATTIVDELDRRIRKTRMQVEELVPRLEAVADNRVALSSTGADAGNRLGDDDEDDDEDGIRDVEDQDLDEEGLEAGDDDTGGGQTDEEASGRALF